MNKPIVVIGSINMDLVVSTERIPVPGETISGTSFRTFPGGKGANQAVAVAKLGHPVYLVGKVGDDVFGRELRQSLTASGVVTDVVGTVLGSSGVALITTESSGQNSIVVIPAANHALDIRDIDDNEDLISRAALVLCQLETPLQTIARAAEVCHRHNVPLMLDPAPARNLPSSLLRKVTWITPNESETCHLLGISLTGDSSLKETHLAERLLAMGPCNVILKMGEKGCFVASAQKRTIRMDAYSVNPVDSTAAGDAFNGAFAVALARRIELGDAIRFASAAAAISVTRHGAQPSMPTLTEVEDFLKTHNAPHSKVLNFSDRKSVFQNGAKQ